MQRTPGCRGLLATVLGVSLFVLSPDAAAQAAAPSPEVTDPDPWFGTDKLLHAGATFALSSGGYALGVATIDQRWAALLLGGGISLALGGLKEGLDAAGLGQPSAKDFVWDVVGTALGLGVAVTFDAALRGPDAP